MLVVRLELKDVEGYDPMVPRGSKPSIFRDLTCDGTDGKFAEDAAGECLENRRQK